MTKEKQTTKISSLPVEIETGGKAAAVIPQSIGAIKAVAEMIIKSGTAPKDMNTAEKVAVAIMHGLEVGFPPMQALQSIAVINGRPTIWGDGALALVRASGLLLDFEEGFEGEGDDMRAFCRCVRKDQKTPIVRTFSIKQAKAARLWTKKGPWTDYKARMMSMRARAFALRDGFADVLKGLAVREEVQDYRPMQKSEAEAISGDELIKQAAEGEKIEEAEFEESSEQDAPSASEEGSPPVTFPSGGDSTKPSEAPETPPADEGPDTHGKPDAPAQGTASQAQDEKKPAARYASVEEMIAVIDVCQTATAIDNSVARMKLDDLFPPDKSDVLEHAEKRKAELAK